MSKGSSLEFMGNQEQERAVSTASHCQVKFKSKAQPGTQGSEWARKSEEDTWENGLLTG